MYHKILVPLYGSKQAALALLLAAEPAKIYNAENALLRVVERLFEMYSRCHPIVLNNPTHPSDNLGQCLLPVSTPVVTEKTFSPQSPLFTRCNAG